MTGHVHNACFYFSVCESFTSRSVHFRIVGRRFCIDSKDWVVDCMPVYLRDGSAQTIICAATLRQKLKITLSILPSHSIQTRGQPFAALTLKRQAPDSHRLAGLVVKASASRAEDPGFESRLHRDFFGVQSYQ